MTAVNTPAISADRFSYKPLIVALAIPSAIIIFRALFGPDFLWVMIGMPASLIIQSVSGLTGLTFAAINAWRRCWRRAASFLAIPLICLTGFIQGISTVILSYNRWGDRIHFEAMRPFYESVLNGMPSKEPKLAVFNWGGMVWASTGVVFDESNELSRPFGSQSQAWKRRASRTELACGGFSASLIRSHWYFVDFPC